MTMLGDPPLADETSPIASFEEIVGQVEEFSYTQPDIVRTEVARLSPVVGLCAAHGSVEAYSDWYRRIQLGGTKRRGKFVYELSSTPD